MSAEYEISGPSRSKRKMPDTEEEHDDKKHVVKEKSDEVISSGSHKCVSHEATLEDSVSQLGQYLSSEYEVLLRVLDNLCAMDLRKASQVCRSWQSAAKVVSGKRLQLHWLFWRANNGGWNIPPPLAMYSAIYEQVFSQPTLALAFFSKNAVKSFECSAPEVTCPKTGLNKPCGAVHSLESFMGAALSKRCQIVSFPVSGVIGSSHDLKSTFEVEHVRGGPQAMSAALFPNHPNVRAVYFHLSKSDLLKICRVSNQCDVVEMLGLPKDMLVQALIMFSGKRVHHHEKSSFIAILQARQEHKFAVGGGVTEAAEGLKGVVFLGNDVCAVSAIIPEHVTEKDQVQEYINKVRSCNLPTECSVAFMFSCLGRGHMWYDGESNVESGILNKTFPKTPIIGFFGGGEIGVNRLFGYPVQDSRAFWRDWNARCNELKNSLLEPPNTKKWSPDMSVNHTYSTCVVLVSFNIASSALYL